MNRSHTPRWRAFQKWQKRQRQEQILNQEWRRPRVPAPEIMSVINLTKGWYGCGMEWRDLPEGVTRWISGNWPGGLEGRERVSGPGNSMWEGPELREGKVFCWDTCLFQSNMNFKGSGVRDGAGEVQRARLYKTWGVSKDVMVSSAGHQRIRRDTVHAQMGSPAESLLCAKPWERPWVNTCWWSRRP